MPFGPPLAVLQTRLKFRLRQAADFSAYVLVRLLVAFIQTLPVDMGDSICRGLAWCAAGPLRIRQDVIRENLTRVFPDSTASARHQLSFAMWHHLMLMVCEIAWAQRRLHLANWKQHVTIRGNRKMLTYMLSDRPLVNVTGHFGNFEIGGYLSGLMGFTTLTIARELDNPYLHRWVERFRGAKGQRMIDKDGCAPVVEKHLNEGGILSLLADQHAGPKGCWVSFLGVPASCHKALALFSLSTDAPMMAGCARRINGTPMQIELACISVADPLHDKAGNCASVKTLTEWYNVQLASMIEQSLEQYWWLHRRWRTPPEKVARRLQRAA